MENVENKENPYKKYLIEDRLPHIFCPGCGNGIVMNAFFKGLEGTDIDFDDIAMVSGDVNRLIQIFTNLINNAIAYSKEETIVKLRISAEEQYGIFEVKDQGIGIEKSELPRIFERFYRIDRARSRNSGGTGLGLSIVKHLIEAHEGKIQVTSEVGKGTSMKVYLPIQHKS